MARDEHQMEQMRKAGAWGGRGFHALSGRATLPAPPSPPTENSLNAILLGFSLKIHHIGKLSH